MVGDVQTSERGDQAIYRRKYESQTAIPAVRAYIYITKKKSQKLKFGDYMNPKARIKYIKMRRVHVTIVGVEK
jgi:hypothetical protein